MASVHFSRTRGGAGFLLPVVVVTTPDAMRRGLSGRDRLPPDQGMLFWWPSDGQRVFWMRDTRVPLDLAFVDHDGGITHVVYGATANSDHLYAGRAQYVVEVPSPWMATHGVVAGGVAMRR